MTQLAQERRKALAASEHNAHRWPQLALGVLCMTMIANLQYSWTLFVNPLQERFGWEQSAIQIAFTIFVLAETWLVPFEGYLEDLFGPKPLLLFGGLLAGAAWIINAKASSLPMLYFAQALGGVGAGAVYATCLGNALKWFPDHRGLAAGVTAAGFGMGSALTIAPITILIHENGYQDAFLYFGLLQGAVVCSCAAGLKSPQKEDDDELPEIAEDHRHRQFTPVEMAKRRLFWLMYAMFVMVAAGGLMATAQLGPIARDFGVTDVPVGVLGFSAPALTIALSIDRVLNGLTRPFFGWVSDAVGREKTMFFAFGFEGLAILALEKFGHTPGMFVLLSGLVFFAWGEIYSLFPATCADTFGSRYAAANAGLLYTAKGAAALLVPLSSLISEKLGWQIVFYIASSLNIAAALLALLALAPARKRALEAWRRG
ncbi:MAG TPA: oxalate/formate MFS antiporter [Methylocystis sp.]|nr:oxalate/formate MFS antiporter [Methylocystis sp.]